MNILVTGGTSGLGEAIVKKLASDKQHHVYFTYAKSEAKAKAIANDFPNTTPVYCDFTIPETVASLIEKTDEYGIDILIHNAIASLIKEHFHKINPEHFLAGFMNNVMPVLQLTQACIKVFRKKKFGKIITINSSYVINVPPTGLADYVACKAYLLAMSKSWATENIRFNITSNTVSPSFMQTPFTADTDERILEQMIDAHPLKRLVTPEEVADSVSFFVNASQQINGVNLVINAGKDIV